MTVRHRTAGALAALVLLTAGGVSACSTTVEGNSVETISAVEGLQQAEDLVVQIAAAVSPGATVEDSIAKSGPVPCESPQQGKVYYSIFKKFPAPDGANGATAKDATAAAVRAAGFVVDDVGDTGGWPTFTGTQTYVGLRVLCSPDTPEIRIVIDTRCGTP